jgi:hypothetical protein
MIKVGDIVFRRYKGGIRNNKPNESVVGLVIKEQERESSTIVAQFQVRFGQEPKPKWYYHHELYKILGEKNG